MTATHRFLHPEGSGLGQHHADGDLADRPAEIYGFDVFDAVTGIVGDLSPAQRKRVNALREMTMADLDMPHGTEVEHIGRDEERGLELVRWTDKFGTDRITSLTPEQFAEWFGAVS